MANSKRTAPKLAKKSRGSAAITRKRERRSVSHTSSVTSLTVLRQRLHHLTRWIFVALGFVLVLGFGLSVPGIQRNRSEGSGDVARVGRYHVERDMFENAVRQAGETQYSFLSGPSQVLTLRNMVLEQIVDHELKLQAARQEGHRVGRKQLKERIEQLIDAIVQQQKQYYKTDKDFQEKYLRKRMKVRNEQELRAKLRRESITQEYIEALREQILIDNLERKVRKQAESVPLDKARPEEMEIHARHILIKTDKRSDAQAKKLARQALDQIRAGGDFSKLAGAKSEDDATRARGGDMDWVGKDGFWQGPELAKAALSLKPGQVSGLIKTRQGYHILKVEGRRYDSTKFWNAYVQGLRGKIRVAVQDPVLRAYQIMTSEARGAPEQKKNREQAIAMFRQALEKTYDSAIRAGIFYTIGNLYLQDNNLAKAAEAFGSATRESPSPEIYLALGDAQRKLKQNNAALESYKMASGMATNMDLQQHYFAHAMLEGIFKEMKETRLAAAEKSWIDRYMKAQQGRMNLPGGSFTVR